MIVASEGTAASPARTESLLVAPPPTPPSRAASSGGTTTTTPSDAASAASAGVIDHAPVAEFLVLLERAEALTGAPTDHDGPDVLSAGHKGAG